MRELTSPDDKRTQIGLGVLEMVEGDPKRRQLVRESCLLETEEAPLLLEDLS